MNQNAIGTESSPEVLLPQNNIVTAGNGKFLNVLGDEQTLKFTGKETGGLFTIIENFNEPGVGIPMHLHENEDEIFHVIEGEMEFVTLGKTSVLKKGDMIFLPRQIPHSFRVVGSQKAKAVVTVMPSGIEKMFYALSALPPGPPDLEKVQNICNQYGIRFL